MPKGNWSWDELVSNYQPLYSVKKKKSGKQSSLNYNKDKIKGKIETILKKNVSAWFKTIKQFQT